MKGTWHFLEGYVKESGLQSCLALFFRNRDSASVEKYVGSDEHLLRDDCCLVCEGLGTEIILDCLYWNASV